MSRHVSQIYAGLFDLSAANQINLEISGDFSPALLNEFHRNVLWLEVTKTGNPRTHQVCFDMQDEGNVLTEAVKKADFYIKRSYQQDALQKLNENLRKKIVPFGLYYPCRSDHEHLSLTTLKMLYLNNRIYLNNKINKRSTNYSYHNRRSVLGYIRYLLTPARLIQPSTCPLLSDIVVKSDQPAEKKILFLTRLWSTHGYHSDMCKKLNDMRVETIRALQSAFGDNFIGGLIPSRFAEKKYPHLVSSERTDKTTYLNYVRKCLITITSTGLWNSIGAKLPEYIAASRCIVTEPLLNKLPTPLEEGKHILTFRNPDECVDACKRILDDPDLARQMRKNNEQYFKDELIPNVQISKLLSSLFT